MPEIKPNETEWPTEDGFLRKKNTTIDIFQRNELEEILSNNVSSRFNYFKRAKGSNARTPA